MARPAIACLLSTILLGLPLPLRTLAQVSPRDPQAKLPQVVDEIRQMDPSAYTFERAWLAVRERTSDARAALQSEPMIRARSSTATAVAGSFQVPVVAVLFANQPDPPYPSLDLERRLFGGGAQAETLTEYYREISGGLVEVGGAVIGWQPLPRADTWYEGTTNGLQPGNARIGELIRDALVARDAEVDFGMFDNDGPDGVPNSGDDDGYVDFVAFVHPESGAECGGSSANIWSHRWRYSAWPASAGLPFQTQDPSARGGVVLVDDYVIQPGLGCDGLNMIQIGVFCHEFGHAFGLPDLYDLNGGGGQGLGHWCLMAAGNWNQPDRPAHPSAWAKRELGWADVLPIAWQETVLDIAPVLSSRTIVELRVRDRRWQRRDDCTLQGSWSLAVGLSVEESQARGWPAIRGYGNRWRETVVHDFHYDGTGPVELKYLYGVESEGGFDYGFALLERGGEEHTLAVFNGSASGENAHQLAPLLGESPTDYRIKFRFSSDGAYSNEDGDFVCQCAALILDDVRVSGGGEDHAADFEQHRDGWYQPDDHADNPPTEAWLVENRQPEGYDSELHGGGLLIYHVDQEIISSRLGNTGGRDDEAARGVVLEEADGLGELLLKSGGNRGDSGDPWPGSTGAEIFDSTSRPASIDNGSRPTRVLVSQIELLDGSIRALLRGGNDPPLLTGVSPDTVSTQMDVLTLELVGAQHLDRQVRVVLLLGGTPPVVLDPITWLDEDIVHAELDPGSLASGSYDVIVENPDGQTAAISGALIVLGPTVGGPELPPRPAVDSLSQNFPNPFNPRTRIRFATSRDGPVRLVVHDLRGREVRALVDGYLPAGQHERQWDGTDAWGLPVASGVYFYRLETSRESLERKMLLRK